MKRTLTKIIGIDVKQYLQDFASFVNDYNQTLTSYYTEGGTYPREAFVTLDDLTERGDKIARALKYCRSQFSSMTSFEVFDRVEDARSVLRLYNNYGRWQRSSVIDGRAVRASEIVYSLKQNQTLESMSREVGWEDPERGSLTLAYRNKIRERDYDLDGGLVFKFSYQGGQSVSISTIVDYMSGQNVLGKDIYKKLTFEDDDLKALSPEDTFYQVCQIFVSLTKNSNPEFPEQGFNKETLSNRNVLNNMLPTFIRQMYSIVGNDDSIAAFSIENTSIEGDALKIDMKFYSYLNTEINQSVYGDSNI